MKLTGRCGDCTIEVKLDQAAGAYRWKATNAAGEVRQGFVSIRMYRHQDEAMRQAKRHARAATKDWTGISRWQWQKGA